MAMRALSPRRARPPESHVVYVIGVEGRRAVAKPWRGGLRSVPSGPGRPPAS